MVYGVLRLINFAHGDVTCWARSRATSSPPRSGWRTNPSIWAAMSAVIAGRHGGRARCSAWLIERFAYRPLRQRAAADLADHRHRRLAAAGVRRPARPFGATGAFEFPFGRRRAHSRPHHPDVSVSLGGVLQISAVQILTFVVALVLMVGLEFIVRRTQIGQGDARRLLQTARRPR